MNPSLIEDLSKASGLRDEEHVRAALDILCRGIPELIELLSSHQIAMDDMQELVGLQSFLQSIPGWMGKMPTPRLREILSTSIRSLVRSVCALSVRFPDTLTDYPSFISDALVQLGPEILLSPDRTTACVRIDEDLARYWTLPRLMESLNLWGIQREVDQNALNALMEKRLFGRLLPIAQGRVPLPGRDSVIEILLPFDRESSTYNQECGDCLGPYDFQTVNRNQPVLRKKPATSGEIGWDVFGQEITAVASLNETLPSMAHCVMDAAGLELRSDINGCAYYQNGCLYVSPARIVRGSVDSNTGSVETDEDVVVLEDVTADFEVRSKGYVAVKGAVGGARIEAGKSVIGKGGVNGRNKATITAAETICFQFINEAQARAGLTVMAKRSILQSHVQARQVRCPEGQIFGGVISAWNLVWTGTLGAELGAKTQIVLGAELPGLQESVPRLASELDMKKQERDKVAAIRRSLLKSKGKIEALTPEDKNKIARVSIVMNKIKKDIEALEMQLEQARKDLAFSLSCKRSVRASRKIYPGTTIQIMDQTMYVRQEMGPATISYRNGELVTEPYRYPGEGEEEE